MSGIRRLAPAFLALTLVMAFVITAYAAEEQAPSDKMPTLAPQKMSSVSSSNAVDLGVEKSARVSLGSSLANQGGTENAVEKTSNQVTVKGESVYVAKESPEVNRSIKPTSEEQIITQDAGILATYQIEGSLAANRADLYGPWYFTVGEQVSVSVSWIPTSSNIRIGLRDSLGDIYYVDRTSGSGSVTFQVNEADNYEVVIWNLGPNAINYNGYITI